MIVRAFRVSCTILCRNWLFPLFCPRMKRKLGNSCLTKGPANMHVANDKRGGIRTLIFERKNAPCRDFRRNRTVSSSVVQLHTHSRSRCRGVSSLAPPYRIVGSNGNSLYCKKLFQFSCAKQACLSTLTEHKGDRLLDSFTSIQDLPL